MNLNAYSLGYDIQITDLVSRLIEYSSILMYFWFLFPLQISYTMCVVYTIQTKNYKNNTFAKLI